MIKYVHRLIIAATLTSTIPLMSGCAAVGAISTVSDVVAAANKPADSFFNTLVDEKAYYGLLKGEATLNRMASDAVDLGLLKAGSPAAVKIADALLKYAEVSKAAQQAKRLNDASTVANKVAEGKKLYQVILDLVK